MDNTNHSIIYKQLASPSSDPFNVLDSDIYSDSSLESSGGVEVEHEGPAPLEKKKILMLDPWGIPCSPSLAWTQNSTKSRHFSSEGTLTPLKSNKRKHSIEVTPSRDAKKVRLDKDSKARAEAKTAAKIGRALILLIEARNKTNHLLEELTAAVKSSKDLR